MSYESRDPVILQSLLQFAAELLVGRQVRKEEAEMVRLPEGRLNVRLNDAVLYRYPAVLCQTSHSVIVGVFRHLDDVAVLRA